MNTGLTVVCTDTSYAVSFAEGTAQVGIWCTYGQLCVYMYMYIRANMYVYTGESAIFRKNAP